MEFSTCNTVKNFLVHNCLDSLRAHTSLLQHPHKLPFPAVLQHTHRFHNGWDSPLRAQQSVAVQLPAAVNVSVQDVHSDHAGVHWVWVFLHGSCCYSFPGMTAKTQPKHEAEHRSVVTGVLCKLNPTQQSGRAFKAVQFTSLNRKRPSLAGSSGAAAAGGANWAQGTWLTGILRSVTSRF